MSGTAVQLRDYYGELLADLEPLNGNIYIYVDGAEYGSLFFHRDDDGRVVVSLGQYDGDAEQWVPRNPVTAIADSM